VRHENNRAKRFGQHFLTDGAISIASSCDRIRSGQAAGRDRAGLGAMTDPLVARSGT
jgi:hypothetical protein